MPTRTDVTALLAEISDGDPTALDRLLPLVYDELREVAHRELRGERAGHTLATTALVHEAYLKLVDLDGVALSDRVHFYRICGRAMRQVLVSYARMKGRKKRGSGRSRVPIDDVVAAARDRPDDLLELEAALERLEEESERHARIVECRFFAGMTVEETADALHISPATVKRDWSLARTWLARELEG